MSLEIRPIREDEFDAFNRNVGIAFAAPGDSHTIKVPVDWTLCAFEDGKLATSYMAWPITLYFSGAEIQIAGVSMVGTLPIYRRKGHLRKITQQHFRNLYEQQAQPISGLFASMAAIYQRFGYGIVSSKNAYNTEPRYLRFAVNAEIKGSFKEAEDKDAGIILDIYTRASKVKVGCLKRNAAMEVAPGAPLTVLAMPPAPIPPLKFIYYENGEPQGYLIYSIDRVAGPKPKQNLIVRDIAWLTPQAYRAIWDCLANMDLIQNITWGKVPPDDPLPHLLLEPRQLNTTVSDGLLARIVDVKRALPLRPYRQEAALTMEIIDDFCPWNGGKWKLEVSPSGAEVKETDEEPQLTMPVSTLAMLMFGQLSATEAARMSRLVINDSGALEVWDRLMRTPYRPFSADMF